MEALERDNIDGLIAPKSYVDGLKKGAPIALAYISVALTFGMIAFRGGMDNRITMFISMTNLTSAGQFAGLDLLVNGAALLEIALTLFIINIRYMLMSLTISQKLHQDTTFIQKCLIAFGMTDEIFTIASLEEGKINFQYMMGLLTLPYIGWSLGTLAGIICTDILPIKLQDALGIALFAMFVALIIPPAKKSKAIMIVVIIAVFISSLFRFIPALSNFSTGFVVIVTSLTAATIGAKIYPVKEVE